MLKYILINIVAKAIWLLPFPTRTRLIEIGEPTEDSPVLATCNYVLTVEKLKKALKGRNLYLLVANSGGINVWCAAAGAHFTHHGIISMIKTSGIERLVRHRRIILPQLAAPGVETRVLREKTGWRGIWGPVRAEDIPAFLDGGMKKTGGMRRVEFPLADRVGIASAWALSMSIAAAAVFFFIGRSLIIPIVASFWGFSLLVFVTFPLYERLIQKGKWRLGPFEYGFELGGLQLILLFLFTLGLFAAQLLLCGGLALKTMLSLEIIALVVILILTTDMPGNTPVYKSSHHEELEFDVVLDEGKCRGTGVCIDVCPRDCFTLNKKRRKAEMTGAARCERCAACIVQCPFDALSFVSGDGRTVSPETTRRYKLNLMGKRSVGA
jgi:ferredoxin